MNRIPKLFVVGTLYLAATTLTFAQTANHPCKPTGTNNTCLSEPSVEFTTVGGTLVVCVCNNVSASASYTNIPGQTETRITYDNCPDSVTTNSVSSIIVTNWWEASGPGDFSTNRPGLSASFSTTNCGTGTVTFHLQYSNAPPCSGSDTLSISTNYTVVAVESLLPDQGCEIDDGDGNPDTRTFVVCAIPFNKVKVCAKPCPNLAEDQLPACWTLTGGSGGGRLCREMTASPPGTNTFEATAGCSHKITKIIVSKADYHVRLATFIPAPFGNAPWPFYCNGSPMIYQGDGRGFSPTSDSYRTLQVGTVVPESRCASGLPEGITPYVGISRNFAQDAIVNGQISAEAMADTVLGDCHLKIGEKQGVQGEDWVMSAPIDRIDESTITVQFTGDAGDPLYWPRCNINWCLTLKLRKQCGGALEWWLTGSHDKFPAFELYIEGNPIYQAMPSGSLTDLCDGDCGEVNVNKHGVLNP